jgi:hypothetical protein
MFISKALRNTLDGANVN